MSPRTFARRFVATCGTTPHAWLTEQRLAHARELLEASELSIEQVAARCGYDSAATLRRHFDRALRTTPTAYRRGFAAA
jgi:transcriptional regulator GlxA family with amidase domain